MVHFRCMEGLHISCVWCICRRVVPESCCVCVGELCGNCRREVLVSVEGCCVEAIAFGGCLLME